MRDYSKVSGQFWIGATGKSLRGDLEAQVLAMYLMTSPHAEMTGIYHCPILYMAHETGLTLEGASKGLRKLIEGAFCDYDEASETVFVYRMAAFQVGESLDPRDKRVTGISKAIEKVAVSRFRARFLSIYGQAFNLAQQDQNETFGEGASKPLRSQEQEQEQEQAQERQRASPRGDAPSPRRAAFVPPTVEEVSEHCRQKGYRLDPDAFVAFYASKGWKVGTAPMRDWRAATVTWHKRDTAAKPPEPRRPSERPL